MGKTRIELVIFDPQSSVLPLHHKPFHIYILFYLFLKAAKYFKSFRWKYSQQFNDYIFSWIKDNLVVLLSIILSLQNSNRAANSVNNFEFSYIKYGMFIITETYNNNNNKNFVAFRYIKFGDGFISDIIRIDDECCLSMEKRSQVWLMIKTQSFQVKKMLLQLKKMKVLCFFSITIFEIR